MTDTPAPPRPVTVPEDLWERVNRVLYNAGLILVAITGSPTQTTRYEVRPRQIRTAAPGTRDLSEREAQVLGFIAAGLGDVEIAEALGLSVNTTKSHVKRLFRKLGARDRANAVALAYQRGFIGGTK
ncbi:MAG: helix-turn-helix transcriptional regulator [Mycobacterium sp.]|uniref:response regulator transcription factor n=1 Tax=Mycobacterium sp. TaxID=1785 RepID=UPI00261525F4|nr:helix-turn-helix transcriptional regulator [Mycobacterium sp.]MDI3315914.1 helix-turn-helix transcriptional regulator [Mycobacterium sp.]